MSTSRNESVLEAPFDWLDWSEFAIHNGMPIIKQPFVRTVSMNRQTDGCFICGRKMPTRHHIRRGRRPLTVFLCWKHHQIMHGVCLEKYSTAELRTTLAVAKEYKLFKVSEAGRVEKAILQEIESRGSQIVDIILDIPKLIEKRKRRKERQKFLKETGK